MLRIRNLESGYDKLRVLKGISLHVAPGEIVTIVGANGAGKTTLLHSISGLVRAWAGEIVFDDKDMLKVQPDKTVFLGCALVPEGRQVFATMSVLENLQMGSYVQIKRKRNNEIKEDFDKIYNLFPVLKDRSNQLAGTLSGGEQQMLAIGRALMSRPKLIMMDEPSMGLAPLIIKDIFNVIAGLREAGTTVLLVEQNAKAALGIADRGYVLETGQIILDGDAEKLLHNKDVQRAYLGKEYKRIED
jgi:branched-chain amino acid transport system ATP-binding protein